MDRMGRGYSFEALRAKILFTEGAHVIQKNLPKFERWRNERIMFSIPDDANMCMESMSRFSFGGETENQHEAPEEVLNLGADISTLVRLIEEGQI